MDISNLKFDEHGLIPAIVQDYYTKQVLTLAYFNRESLQITLDEGKTCFYSRSRSKLWRKGETSGNFQHVQYIKYDCDADALVVAVICDGPACHLGNVSCFVDYIFKISENGEFSLDGLLGLLKERNEQRPEGSYTTYLFEKGRDKILKKVGEESTEVIIASKASDKKETVYEIADLVYHLFVLMVDMGITLQDVLTELESRHIINHKVKQGG